MDPVGQSLSSRTVLSSEKSLASRFLLKVVDLSLRGRTGETFKMALPSDLIRRALFQSGSPGLPLKFRTDLPSGNPFVANLSRAFKDKGGIVVSVRREEGSLLWNFQSETGGFLNLSSPLIPSEKTVIPLKEPGLSSGNEQVRPPVLGLPTPPSAAPPTLSAMPDPTPDRMTERVEGPVIAYPSWVPGKTVEFSVRWIEDNEEEDLSGKKEKFADGRKEVAGRLSFSLDIPWHEDPAVSSGQRPGRPTPPDSRKRTIRLVGLYDRSGSSITLISRNVPDSFRARWEELAESLSKGLAIYPGVALSMNFLSAGAPYPGREPA